MVSERPRLRVRVVHRWSAWLGRRVKQWEARTRRTELREGTREDVHGLAVVIHRTDAASARARLDKVRAALDVIARHDPPSLEAMRTHFSAILVWDWMVAANGSYLHSERLCTLYCDYVANENTEPARIAMTLIHELAHARHSSRTRRQPMSWGHAAVHWRGAGLHQEGAGHGAPAPGGGAAFGAASGVLLPGGGPGAAARTHGGRLRASLRGVLPLPLSAAGEGRAPGVTFPRARPTFFRRNGVIGWDGSKSTRSTAPHPPKSR